MNLRDELMAKCTTSGILRGPKKRKSNVVTIQNAIVKQKESRTRCFSTSGSTSFNLRGRNLSRDDSVSETFGTFNESSDSDCKVVLAITQGRGEATCEVGIAAINTARPSLIMCQISDTLSYTNILTKMNILNPCEILIPTTTTSTRLTEKIKEYFKNAKILGVPRSTFNSNTGFNYVKRVCASHWNSIVLMVQYKYYALTAVSALFSYIENHLYTFYANDSMKVEYEESEGYMIIDVLTADKLELVACALPDINPKYSSLRGILNNCVTKIGSRTLRATILQPPCCVMEINKRLDCVEELVNNQNKLASLREVLGQLSKIDHLLTLASIMPDRASNCSHRQLNYILLLNTAFDLLQPLSELFVESQQPYFADLRETLENKDFDYLKTIVRTVIHENARPATGEQGVTERCFAIKPGVNPILDIIRKRYSERLDELRDYVRQLGAEHNLDLKLSNNVKKGYHIVLKLSKQDIKSFKLSSLPDIFIHVERTVTMVTMTTIDIQTFQIRLEDISVEIIKISNVILYKLLVEIRKYIGIFYKLCEQIAKVDMIQSLALASSSIGKNVRPKFNVFTEVINGRHPLLEYLSDKDPTGNDIFVSPQFNMNIVTGPNSSGKSIYIRQIALLQIMAQIGCFVPASSATFRVADRILARIYLEDDMYCGASAFTLEMKEIKYFFNVMTPNTLIIIDELCRSTSILEGTGLAMAICEKLLQTPAFTFFTTHYTFITRLYDMYYNVQCWQLETEEVASGSERKLVYTHRVLPGVTALDDYAIQSAKTCWPPIVMKDVEAVRRFIEVKELNAAVSQIDPRMRLKYNIEADLQILKYKAKCTKDVVRERMLMYQEDLQKLGTYIDWSHESAHTRQMTPPNMEGFSNLSYEEFIQPEAVYSNSTVDTIKHGLENDRQISFHDYQMEMGSDHRCWIDQAQSELMSQDSLQQHFTPDTVVENGAQSNLENDEAGPYRETWYQEVGISRQAEYQKIVPQTDLQQHFTSELLVNENAQTISDVQQGSLQQYSSSEGMVNEGAQTKSDVQQGLLQQYFTSERMVNEGAQTNTDVQQGHLQQYFTSEGMVKEGAQTNSEVQQGSLQQYFTSEGVIDKGAQTDSDVQQSHLQQYFTSEGIINEGAQADSDVQRGSLQQYDTSGGIAQPNIEDQQGSFQQYYTSGGIVNEGAHPNKEVQQGSLQQYSMSINEDVQIDSENDDEQIGYQEMSVQQLGNDEDYQTHYVNQDSETSIIPLCFTPEVVVNEYEQFSSENDRSTNFQLISNKNETPGRNYLQNASFQTVNEFQFAMPLQRIIGKTSTPLVIPNKSSNHLEFPPHQKLNGVNCSLKRAKSQTGILEKQSDSSDEAASILTETIEYLESSGYDFEDEFNEANTKNETHFSMGESISYSPDYEYLARCQKNQPRVNESIGNLESNEATTSLMNNTNSNSHYNTITDVSNTVTISKSTGNGSSDKVSSGSAHRAEQSFSSERSISRKSTPARLIKPINKMTKKEIEQLYHQRDLKFLNANEEQSVAYSEEILNRPKAKQIKASKQVAVARKINDGSVVVVCDHSQKQQRRCSKFNQPLRHSVGRRFDVTIFSDENSHIFDEFMQTEQDPKRDGDFFNKVFHKGGDTSASSFVSANMESDTNTSFFKRPAPAFNFSSDNN